MKKIIASMFAVMAISASAQVTGIAEYDWHTVSKQQSTSGYYAAGLSYTGAYGTVDAYTQGSKSVTNHTTDNLNGWEVGYGYFFPGVVNVNPRIAYGAMDNIDQVGNARYALASVEVSTALKENVNGYLGASHMMGLNDAAIPSSNRVQAGIDYAWTPKMTTRIGYSRIWQMQTVQNGMVMMAFYSF